jgi:hypothetical protein
LPNNWPPAGNGHLAVYLRGTIVLLVVIVIATLLYLGSFPFSGHPRRIVYPAPTWWCWPGRPRSWRGITAGSAGSTV